MIDNKCRKCYGTGINASDSTNVSCPECNGTGIDEEKQELLKTIEVLQRQNDMMAEEALTVGASNGEEGARLGWWRRGNNG